MFDMTQRRMISAGSNGTVKVWNFSNGSSLKNLCMTDSKDRKTPVVDKEVTALLAVYNENEPDKQSFFVAAGWDRRLRIWEDDKDNDEEDVRVYRDLPTKYPTNNSSQPTHGDDIMSAVYDVV